MAEQSEAVIQVLQSFGQIKSEIEKFTGLNEFKEKKDEVEKLVRAVEGHLDGKQTELLPALGEARAGAKAVFIQSEDYLYKVQCQGMTIKQVCEAAAEMGDEARARVVGRLIDNLVAFMTTMTEEWKTIQEKLEQTDKLFENIVGLSNDCKAKIEAARQKKIQTGEDEKKHKGKVKDGIMIGVCVCNPFLGPVVWGGWELLYTQVHYKDITEYWAQQAKTFDSFKTTFQGMVDVSKDVQTSIGNYQDDLLETKKVLSETGGLATATKILEYEPQFVQMLRDKASELEERSAKRTRKS